ncbi:MAG: bifunctional biotin--[acetyl-CoA-carboxylase] ligase/biotin operon repressor BirA [Vibrio sp.]
MPNNVPKQNPVKQKIIEQLADGHFHSGEELGELFGISRAAISKQIKGLQEWGLDIYKVQGKGYQLSAPMDLLNHQVIQQASTVPVELIPVIGSTNQYLLDNITELESGSVCVAEYQESGRGRRGRNWLSPYGSNLYFSMYWKLESGVAAAMGLSLAIGVAIVDALESLGASGIKLKWPNDIYFEDRKLAGVLVEMSAQTGGEAHIVIGMGLNIHMKEDSNIDQPWASLDQVFKGKTPNRNDIVIALIRCWKEVLEQYEVQGMERYVERWNALDNFKNKPIKLIMGNREVHGIGKGINDQGGVLIETDKGIETYIGGEISLRKAE